MKKLYKNKDWLYQKYIVEKLSTYKVAKICGCSHTTIRNWLIINNIQTRTKSEARTGELNLLYRPLEERLWEKVDKKDNISECWPWIGCKRRSGHGAIGVGNCKKREEYAVMYEIFYKDKIKKGEVVHHTCENPSCCNPFHLVKITRKKHNKLHFSGEKIQLQN